jgi:hypothetical protein
MEIFIKTIMEIYYKNSAGQLEETSLVGLLKSAFEKAGLKMNNGLFVGENHQWIGIVQESKKPSEVTVNITFDEKGNNITGLKVFESPIKRVVDNDDMKQII